MASTRPRKNIGAAPKGGAALKPKSKREKRAGKLGAARSRDEVGKFLKSRKRREAAFFTYPVGTYYASHPGRYGMAPTGGELEKMGRSIPGGLRSGSLKRITKKTAMAIKREGEAARETRAEERRLIEETSAAPA